MRLRRCWREFGDQFGDHLAADAPALVVFRHDEIQHVDAGFMEFINHEPHHPIVVLGDHADTIALPQTIDEVVFEPGKLETLFFDGEDFGHIASNHPADVDADFLFLVGMHAGLLPCRPVTIFSKSVTNALFPGRSFASFGSGQPASVSPHGLFTSGAYTVA